MLFYFPGYVAWWLSLIVLMVSLWARVVPMRITLSWLHHRDPSFGCSCVPTCPVKDIIYSPRWFLSARLNPTHPSSVRGIPRFHPAHQSPQFLYLHSPHRSPWRPQQGNPAKPPPSTGIILSPASDPIPARLVRRIQSGDFVEMRELLADNISLFNQSSELHSISAITAVPPALRPQIREVPSLISWVYCFAAYAAVRTQDPFTRDMLSYARLIIREALRHGGRGWQEYDRSFRRQLAIDSSQPWNILNPSLQASTLVGSSSGPRSWCSLCHEPDHLLAQCALAPLQQGTANNPVATSNPQPPSRSLPRRSLRVCAAWNHGTCSYQTTCIFRHVCAVCKLDHKAINCPSAPEDSEHRRKPPRRPPTTRA